MALFKLEKLKIEAYSDVQRSSWVGDFEAMFNPESFKESYENVYDRGQGVGSSGAEIRFVKNKPSDLNLRLVLDGTGIHEIGILKLGGAKSVSERVNDFLKLAFGMQGDIHEPNYLIIKWGDINLPCRLTNVDINYTSFEKDGKPLRAELDANFISDMDVEKRLREENKTSPDLTHTRLVRSGDTLPLLSKEIYGSSEHYLYIARENGLDDFRNLIPGQEIFFPPLEKQ